MQFVQMIHIVFGMPFAPWVWSLAVCGFADRETEFYFVAELRSLHNYLSRIPPTFFHSVAP